MKATQEELKMIADYRPTEGVDEGTHIYMSDDEIIDFAKQYHAEQLRLCGVSKCLPTEEEWLKLRNDLAEKHIERLSKQPTYFILRAGIEKGMDAIIDRIKANCC